MTFLARRVRWLGLTFAFALVVAACAGGETSSVQAGSGTGATASEEQSAARPSEWGPLAVVASGSGSGEALIEGTIRFRDGCVLLNEQGEMVLLVWPSDRVQWNESTEAITFSIPDGSLVELHDGTNVRMSGGGISFSEGGQSADAFLSSIDWVSSPAPGCVTDTRWFVGYEVSIDADTPAPDEPQSLVAAELIEPECDDYSSCLAGFFLNDEFLALSCAAIPETSVTAEAIGTGRLYGREVTVNLIDGVDSGVMVAVSVPGGECSQNDPDQRQSAWSMAFPGGANQQQLREAICEVGDLSAAQRLANGCHLDEELLACATGPGFPPEVLDDLAVFPGPTDYFGADIEALLGADNPGDLTGWHVIVEEQTTAGGYVQLLLRQDPISDELQYLLDGSDEVFDAPRRCDPQPVR